MNDSDVLQRAAAALRAAHDGQHPGSGFTRARILATLEAAGGTARGAGRERLRRLRWLVAAPFATLLLVGSAWAQSTGNWVRVWEAVATVLPFVKPAPRPAAPRGNSISRPAERAATPAPPRDPGAAELSTPEPSVVPAPTAVPDEVLHPEPEHPEPEVLRSPAPERPRSATPKRDVASARRNSQEPSGRRSGSEPGVASTPAEPRADPELGSFRAAHELHVQGAARAAIEAYAEYLRAYPRGRFVPEARYNSALDRIKLGDTAAARAALAPFAAGDYGGYRQREARELLDALPR